MPVPASTSHFRVQIALISMLLFAAPFGFVKAQQMGEQGTHTGRRHHKVQCLPPPSVIFVDTLTSNIASIYVCEGDVIKFDTTDHTSPFSLDFQESIVDPPRLHFDDRDRNVAFKVKKLVHPGKKEDHKFVLVLESSKGYFDPHVIIVPGGSEGQHN